MTIMKNNANDARRAAKDAAVDCILEYLRWNPDSSVHEIMAALGVARSSAGIYINELRAAGLAHVSGRGNGGCKGRQAATWSYGAGPGIIVTPDDGIDDEPVIRSVTRWAHGTATRYRMGREVAA